MTNNGINISDFLDNDYCKAAAYDSLRSIASYVDGLKISARKAIYVAISNQSFKRIKVSQLGSEVAKETEYLHGEASIQSVIVNLAKNHVGTNNINYFTPDGNFGCRFNDSPAATRYIYVMKEKCLDSIFIKDDLEITKEQFFEGSKIEPYFLLPTLPMLLINGSDGIGTGFRQVILPRSPEKIARIVNDFLKGDTEKYEGKRILPEYKGFKGEIRINSEGSWEIYGKIHYESDTVLIIDEIPIGYDLNSYTEVLDDLKDKGYIKSYKDQSENDIFRFIVKIQKAEILSEEELLIKFKLVKRQKEIFTCITEENRIVELENEFDIIREYLRVKLEYVQKRKDFILAKIKRESFVLKNKILFIRGINDDEIIISKRTSSDIISQLESKGLDKIDNSYSYLLNMKIDSLTLEKITDLEKQFKKLHDEYKTLKETSVEDIYLGDVENLLKTI